MQFESKIAKRIAELHQEIQHLENALRVERMAFIATKVAEGWQEFRFYSEYYGSHPEYGEGDSETIYLFHPAVDLSRWNDVRFAHGHHGQNNENDAFRAWLEGLTNEQYIDMYCSS